MVFTWSSKMVTLTRSVGSSCWTAKAAASRANPILFCAAIEPERSSTRPRLRAGRGALSAAGGGVMRTSTSRVRGRRNGRRDGRERVRCGAASWLVLLARRSDGNGNPFPGPRTYQGLDTLTALARQGLSPAFEYDGTPGNDKQWPGLLKGLRGAPGTSSGRRRHQPSGRSGAAAWGRGSTARAVGVSHPGPRLASLFLDSRRGIARVPRNSLLPSIRWPSGGAFTPPSAPPQRDAKQGPGRGTCSRQKAPHVSAGAGGGLKRNRAGGDPPTPRRPTQGAEGESRPSGRSRRANLADTRAAVRYRVVRRGGTDGPSSGLGRAPGWIPATTPSPRPLKNAPPACRYTGGRRERISTALRRSLWTAPRKSPSRN